MNAPRARGIGETTADETVGVKAQLSHCPGNRCC
jgi:hypothetical protein